MNYQKIIKFVHIFLLIQIIGIRLCQAQLLKPDLFSCKVDTECALHEDGNCCMPWFTALNWRKVKEFESQARKERERHADEECICPQSKISNGDYAIYLQCLEKMRRGITCANGKCKLPLHRVVDEIESYCSEFK